MHAFVTMEIDRAPMRLQKINSKIYYHESTGKFYKTTLLDQMTAFVREDLVRRQNLVITEYNPKFLVLQEMSKSDQIQVDEIPKYLSRQLYECFGDYDENKNIIYKNTNKIMDFLQKKALAALNFIEQKQYYKQDYIKLSVESQERRQIPNVVFDILRQDIPQIFLDQLVFARLKKQTIKKMVVNDNYQQPVAQEPKKKKPPTKQKPEPVVPANQKTLFSFMNKSKPKQ